MPKRVYNIHLKGYVGGRDFDRNAVDSVLDGLKGQAVSVLIDSTGGNLATALSISHAFANHGDVSVHYAGMNASAATIASMGAKHISIDRAAMYLVHKASFGVFEWGSMNADELESMMENYRKLKNDLDKIDLNIAAMYASRCKRPVKDLLDLMKEGAWLNAEEALEWGFVDEITDFEEDLPATLHQAAAEAMSRAGIPLPNMPVISDFWSGVLSKLQSILSPVFNNTKPAPKKMIKKFTNICTALAIEGITLADERASLTDSQLQTLENYIAGLNKKLEERDAEIETLKKQPAQPTAAIADDKPDTAPQNNSAVETYVAAVNAARQYFKNNK